MYCTSFNMLYTVGAIIGACFFFLLSCSSSSESDASMQFGPTLKEDLAEWITSCDVKHNHVDQLLQLLRKHGHDDLPLTTRSLLKIQKNVQNVRKSDMDCVYFPVEQQITAFLDQVHYTVHEDSSDLGVSMNIDGLPLFKSSQVGLWPVLCRLHVDNNPVFPLLLTCGRGKPSDLDFLEETISQLETVLSNGVVYQGYTLTVRLVAVVCDAPSKVNGQMHQVVFWVLWM